MKDKKFPTTPADLKTSRRMQRVRQKDTAAELYIRQILFSRGFRYRKNHRPVPELRTRADLVFIRPRVAVYVNGCFWHGCPKHATWPKKNKAFWRKKIEANVARDRNIDAALMEFGWEVVRVWEHENPKSAASRIADVVNSRSRAP